MNKPIVTETSTIVPVEAVVVERSQPKLGVGHNVAFHAIARHDPNIEVGYIGGFFENGLYGDIDTIDVNPEFRGQNFGSQLFMHFIQDVVEKRVQSISLSAANERTAHMMGTIPGVKHFEFSQDNVPIPGMTVEAAVRELEEQRRSEFPDDPKGTQVLKNPIRITAEL